MMNNIDNLDYSINTTLKNNKLQIEYRGKIFKENPALITKQTSIVNVKETNDGFIVELDVKKEKELNFSINNINNKTVKKDNIQLSEITDLTVIEKISIWKKIAHYIKKITFRSMNGTIYDKQN